MYYRNPVSDQTTSSREVRAKTHPYYQVLMDSRDSSYVVSLLRLLHVLMDSQDSSYVVSLLRLLHVLMDSRDSSYVVSLLRLLLFRHNIFRSL